MKHIFIEVKVKATRSCPTLFNPMDCTLSMEFPRPEYWSGKPIRSPADLPDPRIKQGSSTLQEDSLLADLPGRHINCLTLC